MFEFVIKMINAFFIVGAIHVLLYTLAAMFCEDWVGKKVNLIFAIIYAIMIMMILKSFWLILLAIVLIFCWLAGRK